MHLCEQQYFWRADLENDFKSIVGMHHKFEFVSFLLIEPMCC